MKYRSVGDLQIPIIGLGLFSMHQEELETSMKTALDSGYSLFDTAYRYDNEKEIGSIIAKSSMMNNRSIICTKVSGLQYNGHRHFLYLDRINIKRAVTRASKKLVKTPVDILLLHSPFSDYQKAYQELLQAQHVGLVKIIGVSGFEIKQLEQIKQYSGVYPQLCMLEIHPYNSSIEIVDYCKSKGIQIIARSPFAHGKILEDLTKENIFNEIVFRTQKSVPQIILRWCIQHEYIVIPRSQKQEHIKENINVFDFNLTEREMMAIDSLNKNRSFGVR